MGVVWNVSYYHYYSCLIMTNTIHAVIYVGERDCQTLAHITPVPREDQEKRHVNTLASAYLISTSQEGNGKSLRTLYILALSALLHRCLLNCLSNPNTLLLCLNFWLTHCSLSSKEASVSFFFLLFLSFFHPSFLLSLFIFIKHVARECWEVHDIVYLACGS